RRATRGRPRRCPVSDAWPLTHPVLATITWSVGIIAAFAPLAVRRYRRVAGVRARSLASFRRMELDRPAVVVALLTPYDDGGAPDAGALRAHVDLLVEAGVDALMPGGTTGEGALLADEELAAVVGATVAAANGRVPVLAHVGRP